MPRPDNNVTFVAADPGFVASDVWRNYNVVFRTVAGALALNTEEGAMTSVRCASADVARGAATPFAVKMSSLFPSELKLAYDLGMPFLTRLCHGFVTKARPRRGPDANEKLWALSRAEFCLDARRRPRPRPSCRRRKRRRATWASPKLVLDYYCRRRLKRRSFYAYEGAFDSSTSCEHSKTCSVLIALMRPPLPSPRFRPRRADHDVAAELVRSARPALFERRRPALRATP